MKYTLVKPDGSLGQSRNFDDAPPTITPNKGRWLPDSPPEFNAVYYTADVVVPVPVEATSVQYNVVAKDITELRAMKKAEINAARDAEEQSGFLYLEHVFDSDFNAIKRISIVVQAATVAPSDFTIDWTTQDGSIVTLTKSDLLMMPVVMATVANVLHVKARTLKAQIETATVEELINIVW